MNVVGAVLADFERNFLGGPSALPAMLGSRPVIEHTLGRLARAEIEALCVVVRPEHAGQARQVLLGAGLSSRFDVLPLDDGRRPRRELIAAARRWNPDGWRGTPMNTTWFDEFVEPACVARVLDHYRCDAVLCIEGHQAALDPGLATAMVGHYRENPAEARFVFTQAPPGLAGILLSREVTADLLRSGLFPGILLTYRPETPQLDPITRPQCLRIERIVSQTACRLVADTRRSRDRLARAFAQLGEGCGAVELCAWVREDLLHNPQLREVELELTTDDPLPDTRLRPRGRRVPQRVLGDLDNLVPLLDELAAYDDARVVLAGHGDPLRHPQFAQVCRLIRARGICALGVVTPLVELSDEALSALFETPVDALEVQLDADEPDTYRRLHGADRFREAVGNIERIERLRRQRAAPRPILLPSLIRCAENLEQIEAFYDRWIRAVGSAVIRGYSRFGDVLEPGGLRSLAPPVRTACKRLNQRLVLAADGGILCCDQDLRSLQRLGDWRCESVMAAFRSPAMERLRRAHERVVRDRDESALADYPVCQRCTEWFRP